MITPAFALDFTIASLDSRVTLTRALNTATHVNSSGYIQTINANLPRFDYDPITKICKGLLIEESRQNICLQSAGFSDVSWNKGAATITANATTSPDGNNNGFFLKEDANLTNHEINRAITTATTTTYTASVFAKPAVGVRYLVLSIDGGGSAYAAVVFDLVTGLSTQSLAAGYTGTVALPTIAYADGNLRCSFTTTTNATAATSFRISLANSPTFVNFSRGRQSYQGDNTSGIYAWGAQLESGAFVTSYIPTTTTSLTRNADVATITGTNFSNWWQAGLGGVTAQALPSTVSGTRSLIQFDDGTANEIIALRGNTTNPELYIVDGGTPQAQIDAGTIAANTAYSLTGWWQPNFCAARKDNGARVEDLTATIPTVTQARLGSDGTNYLNGHLATINYYDQFSGQIYTRRKNKVIFTVV